MFTFLSIYLSIIYLISGVGAHQHQGRRGLMIRSHEKSSQKSGQCPLSGRSCFLRHMPEGGVDILISPPPTHRVMFIFTQHIFLTNRSLFIILLSYY